MQEHVRKIVEQLHGAVNGIESAVAQAGNVPYERQRALEIFKGAKGELLASVGALEAVLSAHASKAKVAASEA